MVAKYTGFDGNVKGPRPTMDIWIRNAVEVSGLKNLGSWVVREQRGKTTPSVHGTGRAVDLGFTQRGAPRSFRHNRQRLPLEPVERAVEHAVLELTHEFVFSHALVQVFIVEGIVGMIIGSSRSVDCTFEGTVGQREHYVGTIGKLGIVRTFQIVQVISDMTVLENVMTGGFLRHTRVTDVRRKAEEVLGFAGLVDRLIEEIRASAGGDAIPVFLHGGDADSVAPLLRTKCIAAPHLVAEGVFPDKTGREYVLRRQMKAIQQELGDDDPARAETEDLR